MFISYFTKLIHEDLDMFVVHFKEKRSLPIYLNSPYIKLNYMKLRIVELATS